MQQVHGRKRRPRTNPHTHQHPLAHQHLATVGYSEAGNKPSLHFADPNRNPHLHSVEHYTAHAYLYQDIYAD